MKPANRILQPFTNLAQRMKEWVTLHLISQTSLGEVEGITVSDLSLPQQNSTEFLQTTREAVELIKQLDGRRYRRVRGRIDYIVNSHLISGGDYEHRLKICNVDYTKNLTSSNHEWNVRRYACILVHEATHGLIFDKKIPYEKETRERIERLCHLEEYRFALRFDPEYAEKHLRNFNEEYYKWYWESTRGSKLRARWRRLKESWSRIGHKDQEG